MEENIGGSVHEYVSAFGVSAQMTGQTENSTVIALPGGVQALYAGGYLQRYRFPDWQGTIRAESNPVARTFTESLAFAPFGERYSVQGSPYNVDSFTGQPDQLTSDEYDFSARELHNGQGRWISPDPLSGTGNKYVYADNNPLSKVDLYGMIAIVIDGIDYGGMDATFDGYKFQVSSNESKPAQEPPTSANPSVPGSASEQEQQKTNQQPAQLPQQKTLRPNSRAEFQRISLWIRRHNRI